MENFFDKFLLKTEQEDYEVIEENINRAVVFRGTNLWILIFAIFVASLGLNVNSTAVIIGAMLISPLMGPIMGIGFGLGINDFNLWRKAFYNYGIATMVALVTSTLFFTISPLSDAHSEILARTAPNIYDVMIALFGGLAGILGTSSKMKGNIIPGVAIATALMPPLCTAGYGIATLQFQFFFGAFYLYIINSVFIALATLLFVSFLKFPTKQFQNERLSRRAHRIVWALVVVTLLPSIYFGYDVVQREKFLKNANRFIQLEANFEDDYLLSKRIDAKEKMISLVFGGKKIPPGEIEKLKLKMRNYGLSAATLEIKQGFSFLSDNNDKLQNADLNMLTNALEQKNSQDLKLKASVDSINNMQLLATQVHAELLAQFPQIQSSIIQPATEIIGKDSLSKTVVVAIKTRRNINSSDRKKMTDWLQIRLKQKQVTLIVR